MGFFSGGKSTATSDAYSGLRGTNYFQPLASQLPGGFDFGLNYAKGQLGDTNPLQIGDNGLTNPQLGAFKTLSDQLFSNNSGQYASRGILSPESTSAISGSVLSQLGPQLMQQVFQNQLANQQIKADRFAALKGILDSGTGMLGSESHSTATSTGGNLLGGALAGAIGKWASPDWMVSLVNGAQSGGNAGSKAFF